MSKSSFGTSSTPDAQALAANAPALADKFRAEAAPRQQAPVPASVQAARHAKAVRAQALGQALAVEDSELEALELSQAAASRSAAAAGPVDVETTADPAGAAETVDAETSGAPAETAPAASPAADSSSTPAAPNNGANANSTLTDVLSGITSNAGTVLSLAATGLVVSNALKDKTPEPVLTPVAALAADSNSGSLADNLTNAQKPVISGTGTPGQTIRVTSPTGEVMETQVGTDGTWQVQPTQAVPDGAQDFRVVQVAADGRSSEPVTVSVVIDSTPAVVGATAVALATDTGAADGVTQNNTPAIEGTGTPGDVVTVLIAGQTLTATIGADGHWSVTPQPLGDGKHSAEVTVTDAAGNVSPAATLGITVDATPPELAITSPVAADGFINAAERSAVVVSGTSNAEAGQTVTVSFSDGTQRVTATAVVAADGTWAMAQGADLSGMAQGAIAITANVSDVAGNAAPQAMASAQLDSVAPMAPSVDAFYTNDTTPEIHGSTAMGQALAAGETLSVSINGATYAVTPGELGRWSINLETAVPTSGTLGALVDGQTYAVTATVTDSAGNATSHTRADAVVVDTTPPAAPTINSLVTHDSTPVITGTTGTGAALEAGAHLRVYVADGLYDVTPDNQGDWSVALGSAVPTAGTLGTLVDGQTYSVTALVFDAAGNHSETFSTQALRFDTSIHATADAATMTEDAASVTGNVMSNDTPLDGSEHVALVGSATGMYGSLALAADGSYTYTRVVGEGSSSLMEAVQDHFTYRVTDAAGNSTEQTLTVELTPVNDAPTWTGTALPVSIVEQTATMLNGRGLAFSDVDAGSSMMQLTIAGQAQDVLNFAAGSSGVNLMSEPGSSTLVLSGTLAQLNALLASDGETNGSISYSTLAYTAETAEGRSASELSFTISDMGNTGAGESMSATQTLAVEITADTTPLVANGGPESITMGGLGDDTLDAGESFMASLYGGSGNDTLRGGFDSHLFGGSGNDVLVSGYDGRFNSMEGGAGNDQFVVNSGNGFHFLDGRSVIADFRREEGNMDTLLLSNLVDADGNGVVNAGDLNYLMDPENPESMLINRVEFYTSGSDLVMSVAGEHLFFGGDTVLTGGASYYTGNSADTLASLMGSGALVIDPTPAPPLGL